MQLIQIASKVSNAAVAAQAGVAVTNATPFLVGRTVIAKICFDNVSSGAPVVKIQTSPDNVNWTDALVSDGSTAGIEGVITLDVYYRTNVTTAGGAGGVFNAYLMGDV